jgi:membrane protease YdiL (CAAX protease family)
MKEERTTQRRAAMIRVLDDIFVNLAVFLPFIALVYLFNLSEGRRTPENPGGGKEVGIVGFVIIGLIYAAGLLLGLILHIPNEMTKKIAPGLWIPSLVALLLLIPGVRRLAGRLLPIDPANRVHAASLSLSLLVFVQIGVTLGIGLENLSRTEMQSTLSESLAQLWSQDLLLALLAFIGVGWLTRRNGKEAMQRLGLTRTSAGDLLKGVVIGLVLMAFSMVLEHWASSKEWLYDPNVEKWTEKLLAPLFESVFGILTLGLAAALGEESLFRGALQPRFGLVYTTILFALVHANYGLSLATLVVFAVGLILGLIRIRYNTVVSMTVHATYNIGLGVLSVIT